MKKTMFFALVALLLVSCGQKGGASDASFSSTDSKTEAGKDAASGDANAASNDEDDWAQSYSGKFDNKIEVQLDLKGHGDVVRGTITYKSSGKPIMVLGSLEDDGTLFLREYQADGLVTGTMSGSSLNGKFVGNWYGSGKDLKLDLAETSKKATGVAWPYAAKSSVAGEYGYHYPDVETGDSEGVGGITVKEKGGKLTFSIDCVTGPPAFRTASIEETEATLDAGEIRYTLPEGDCQFVIRFFDGFAVVEHIGDHFDCGFGMGASIEGEFVKLR